MKQKKMIYVMPEMEMIRFSESDVYTDIVQASGNLGDISETQGSDYGDMPW